MTFRTFPLYLAVPVIAGVLLLYFNRSTPDVRYSLSERIPVSFANSDDKPPEGKPVEVVQQLEVKNIGNLQADNILVKIRGSVKGYILNKHAQMDVPKVTDRERLFEVLYPALPPGGSFQLSFKSSGDVVSAKDVLVSDSRGLASDALPAVGPRVITYVSLFLGVVYILLILSNLRSKCIVLWKSMKRRKPIGYIISSARPFYMSDKEWKGALIDTLKETINGPNRIGLEICKHSAYQFLQLDAPSAIANEAEWKDCVELAVETLEKEYLRTSNAALTDTQIFELLATQKPKDFPESQWMMLEANASEQYLRIRKRGRLTSESAIKCLQEVKPAGVTCDAWQSLNEHWQNEYYTARTKWVTGTAALKYLKETRPDAVPDQLWDKLTESWESQFYAYVMDELSVSKVASSYAQDVDTGLLTPTHSEYFKQRVWSANNREREEARADLVAKLLGSLLKGNEIQSERPAVLLDHEWNSIKRLQAGLQRLRVADDLVRENAQKASELNALEIELNSKHEKVKRQMQLIHDVLTEPSAIDRVECYDETFAKGNWDNLKRLVQASQLQNVASIKKPKLQSKPRGSAQADK